MRIPERPRLILLAAIGIVVFIGGVALALRRLPEWRNRNVPNHDFFAIRLREASNLAGLEVESDPRTTLRSKSWIHDDDEYGEYETAYDTLGTGAADWLAREGRGPYVEATARTRWPNGDDGELHVLFSTRGVPIAAMWILEDPFSGGPPRRNAERGARQHALTRIFLPPGASPRVVELEVLGQLIDATPIPQTSPAETALGFDAAGTTVVVQRIVGSVAWLHARLGKLTVGSLLMDNLAEILIIAVLYLGTLGLFVMLLARRRIELSKGAIVGAISIALSIAGPIRASSTWIQLVDALIAILAKAFVLFILWSTAESWLRSTIPGFRTSLDTLRAGRLGPKGGKALLVGWFAGAVAAGLWLTALAVGPMFGSVAPVEGSVRLPVFGQTTSPIDEGAIRTGLVLLAICAALRIPLIRRVRGMATLLAALVLATRVPLTELWFCLIAGLVLAIVLVRTYAAFGLTALLSASLASTILPSAVFSLLHYRWLTTSAIVLVIAAFVPVVFGAIGIRRSPEIEDRPYAAPAFVRRLESENRVKYEMDLLARMQLGLLPHETPRVDGYEIAARSILATEAGGDLYDFLRDARGRLWIAAGDVSGHGYSCAIAQAMTKAGLASLVESDRTPAMVLDRLDRVLRGIGSRTFTTLALLRLDLDTGDALISNAGHPYPWLVGYAEAREIELPSLPLGQGPVRTYADSSITIEPGMTLVLSSDGLFEGTDPAGHAYGFDRMRPVLRKVFSRPAEAILTAIVEDWREHVGPDAPPDDTTIVVVKRKAS